MSAALDTTNLPEILAEVTDTVNRVANIEGRDLTELPDGTGEKYAALADQAAGIATVGLLTGQLTFHQVMAVAFMDSAAQEPNSAELREALVGLTATAVLWINAIDNRKSE